MPAHNYSTVDIVVQGAYIITVNVIVSVVCLWCVKLAKLDENATQFDKIAAAAHQKFNTLAATVMESMVGRKVMAAIVMTSDQISIESGCVISLATGQYDLMRLCIQC